MIMKFFLYEKIDKNVFCLLPDLPDNYEEMEETGEVFYKGREKASGIKWENVNWFYNSSGFEVPDFEELKYIDGELTNGK